MPISQETIDEDQRGAAMVIGPFAERERHDHERVGIVSGESLMDASAYHEG